MIDLPTRLRDLIKQLAKLPGLGSRSAERLAMAILKKSASDLLNLTNAITEAKSALTKCNKCGMLVDDLGCLVCDNPARDTTLILVLEEPLEVYTIEKSGKYNGLYHILGGAIDPASGVYPEDLNIEALINRVKNGSVTEVILATNLTLQGETTALYLKEYLKPFSVKVSILARGVPSGAQLSILDAATLANALDNRTSI